MKLTYNMDFKQLTPNEYRFQVNNYPYNINVRQPQIISSEITLNTEKKTVFGSSTRQNAIYFLIPVYAQAVSVSFDDSCQFPLFLIQDDYVPSIKLSGTSFTITASYFPLASKDGNTKGITSSYADPSLRIQNVDFGYVMKKRQRYGLVFCPVYNNNF